MRVGFENGVSFYSGKYDEVVYQKWLKGRLCYVRKYAYPAESTATQRMSEIAANLSDLYNQALPGYIADLKAYAKKNYYENLPKAKAKLHKRPSSKSLFVRCMWLWYKSDPTHIDLKTVTLADVLAMESPVLTVQKSVLAGYIKRVTGFNDFTHPLYEE